MNIQEDYTPYGSKDPKKLDSKVSKVSSLDNTSITCRLASNKKKRKARFWNRILSFVTRLRSRKIKGYRFVFLTLTSSPLSSPTNILNDWNILKKRIERRYGKVYAFIVREWNMKGDLIHLHILLYAPYISQSWLSVNWNDIHKAKVIYIEAIRESELESKVFGYLAKYVSKDFDDPTYSFFIVRRFSYSCFFPRLSLLWKKYVGRYIEIYGYNIPKMIKYWDIFITTKDDWDYSTLFEFIMSI